MTSKENAAETTAMLLKELNISAKDWRKLLAVPELDLLSIQAKFPTVPPFIEKNSNNRRIGFGSVVDGEALPYPPLDPTDSAISKNKHLFQSEESLVGKQSVNTY